MGVEIVSTGGTATLLRSKGIASTAISDVTGFPEMLDGRVKTLHPLIFAGILARRDSEEHMQQLQHHHIKKVDMVVVNLYPFKETALQQGDDLEALVENIDIGGPSMIRAAAKNFESVAVVTSPASYLGILEEMKAGSAALSLETRKRLMLEAYRHTANYDCMVSSFLNRKLGGEDFPSTFPMPLEKVQGLRYGENPEQIAAFYADRSAAASAFPGRRSCTARSCPTTTSSTWNRRWSCCGSSRRGPQSWSSSTPIPVASPAATAWSTRSSQPTTWIRWRRSAV